MVVYGRLWSLMVFQGTRLYYTGLLSGRLHFHMGILGTPSFPEFFLEFFCETKPFKGRIRHKPHPFPNKIVLPATPFWNLNRQFYISFLEFSPRNDTPLEGTSSTEK